MGPAVRDRAIEIFLCSQQDANVADVVDDRVPQD